MGSPRVQRWAVHLSAYEYNTVYKSGKHKANADAISRLPVPETVQNKETTEPVLIMDLLDDTLVDITQIKCWAAKDAILSQVQAYFLKGWPTKIDTLLKSYHQRKMELSVMVGCLHVVTLQNVEILNRDKYLDEAEHILKTI